MLEAYFEVVDPEGGLPIIGHWVVYGLVTEWIGVLGLAGILVLIVIRQLAKRAPSGSRFTGSTMWQGYFVEAIIVGVLICGFLIRGFKVANGTLRVSRPGPPRSATASARCCRPRPTAPPGSRWSSSSSRWAG